MIRRGASRRGGRKAYLADVPPEKVFYLHDGRVLKNLEELADALREMAEETFRHHVTPEKNDFSNWIRDVIGDTTLARDLQKASERATAANLVKTWLA